jgi:hypothetical protein
MPNVRRAARTSAVLLFAFAGCNSNSPKQGLPIGSPCIDSAQCGTNPPYFCDLDHPNGYCKADCQHDSDCPSEAICAHDGITVGECHKRCDTVADCRSSEGYVCHPPSTDPVTLASHSYCDAAEPPDDGGMDGP